MPFESPFIVLSGLIAVALGVFGLAERRAGAGGYWLFAWALLASNGFIIQYDLEALDRYRKLLDPHFSRRRMEALAEPIERVFDARGGANVESGVLLAEGLGPGRYAADLFFHVQYEVDGAPKILNKSAMTLSVSRLL